jgi:hypothetical protein
MKLSALILASSVHPVLADTVPCSIATTLLGEVNSAGTANQVQVVGSIAYVVDWFPSQALQIFDVSDPASPSSLGSLALATSPIGFSVEGTTVYLPGSSSGLRIIDASDPTAPTQVGFFAGPGAARDIVVRDGIGYLAQTNALKTIDVSDPANPIEIGSSGTILATIEFVDVVGDYAFTTDFIEGIMQIFSIADPASVDLVGSLAGFGFVTDIDAEGTDVYVTESLGFHIIDASDPSSPVSSSFTHVGNVKGIKVVGSTAYIAGGAGLEIFDVSDPSAPINIGSYNTPQASRGIAVIDQTAYIADDSFGLQIVGLSEDCPECAADFTSDGTLDVFDVFAFLDAFNNADPAADFTADGVLDIFDVFSYLDTFNAGCP